MKSRLKILIILFILIMFSVVFTKKATAQQPYVSFQVFYDQLSPFGHWIENPNYGYVWIPEVGSDFVPYSTDGHWIMTEYGFTWWSDYNWGWAPFHYGRWDFDNYYGWFWVPGNEWGPAWVSWRRSEGYYGWSPMEPGISLNISFARPYNSFNDHWIFVRDRDIDRSDINNLYVNRIDRDRIIRNSTVINNTYFDSRRNVKYISGPAREDVQKVTGRRINPVTIAENVKPGQGMRNGQLNIYRPEITNNNERAQKPVPSRITNVKDIKPTTVRNPLNKTEIANPVNNNRRENQPNNSTAPVKKVVPAQQPVSNPANNTRREVQQNSVNPAKSNIKTIPVQQQDTNPANNRREVQQNTVNPPKNNNNNGTKVVQPVPAANTKQNVPQNTINQQRNNSGNQVQQKSVNPTQNNKNEKQQVIVKPPEKKQTDPPKKTNGEEAKKEKN